MIHSITSTPTVGVVHIRCTDQLSLCKMFVRLQEFYESPLDGIRGHYFTLDYFKQRYLAEGVTRSKKRSKDFWSQYDWHGFNVPGDVVRNFFDIFKGSLTEDELLIRDSVAGFAKFYLIGSHEGDASEDAHDHELVHATWYLDPGYNRRANQLVHEFRDTPTGRRLVAVLKLWGYSDAVMNDEINAYMATTDEAWWEKETKDPVLAAQLWEEGYDFRALASAWNTNRWLPLRP